MVGFGVLADAIGETIAQSAKVFSAVTEHLKKAVNDGIEIYETIGIQHLKHTLVHINSQMSLLNGVKGFNIEQFRDYQIQNLIAADWPTLQKQCAEISNNLDDLLARLGNDDTVLVIGTGLATAGDLKAALLYQSSIYLRLSTLGEPVTPEDRTKLAPVIDKLENLRKDVVTLESSIDEWLKKFAGSVS
jgi:hypothetical protein